MIRTESVSKIYRGGGEEVLALTDISVDIDPGEIVSLLGPSGCGKSTFLNILAGLMSPTKGMVEVDADAPRPRREVGVMFQRSLLFPWRTALENVLLPAEVMGLPKDQSRERGLELLALVGLDGWEHRYPAELSGGMQQRVALARVLLPDPDLLLLDEPFGALDEMTRETLDLELERLAGLTEKTVVLVTHSVYEAVLISHRIFVFTPRPGRIAGVIPVPFERPRDLASSGTAQFAETVARVRAVMAEGDHGNP
jgi:NitT/TauT family transport system ATP-binding protein